MSNRVLFSTQGYSDMDNLWFRPGPCRCGNITDGVALAHDQRGDWIVSFADLERMYLLAKQARQGMETAVATDWDESKCSCVYATAENTESVRKGFEVGGYVKETCIYCATNGY